MRRKNNFVLNLFHLAALRLEQGLKDTNAIEQDEVNFEIKLSKSDTRGKWFKDGKPLYPDQKY